MEDNDTINERERILKIIEEWRVQLEDKGFITIDKRYVNELIEEINKK